MGDSGGASFGGVPLESRSLTIPSYASHRPALLVNAIAWD